MDQRQIDEVSDDSDGKTVSDLDSILESNDDHQLDNETDQGGRKTSDDASFRSTFLYGEETGSERAVKPSNKTAASDKSLASTSHNKLQSSKAEKISLPKRKSTSSSRLPARLKEPAAVARRNARERRRVKMVNDGFSRLRKHVPADPKNRKLSKVKTLRMAIDYIKHLKHLLMEAEPYGPQLMYTAQPYVTAYLPMGDMFDPNRPLSWIVPEPMIGRSVEIGDYGNWH